MQNDPIVGRFYRHYKGGLYYINAVAEDEENPQRRAVVYTGMDGRTWFRNVVVFNENVAIGDKAHKTRYSDSSIYDEVCTLCGATDAMKPITGPCPKAEGNIIVQRFELVTERFRVEPNPGQIAAEEGD